jgi:hypothetical protein
MNCFRTVLETEIHLMRKILPILCLFLQFFLASSGSSFGRAYVQYSGDGEIDWSNGVVEAIGFAYPPANPISPAQARALTKSKAEAEARRHLFDIIREINVDSKILIKNYMDQKTFPFADLYGLIKRAEVVDVAYLENGSVKAVVSMSLMGPFAQLFLPKNILKIATIRQPQETKKKEDSYTGLVVDCRGLPLKPAMAPVILDEDGHEVYGSAYVSREHAVRVGVVSYARDLAAALKHTRVGPRPLIIKGIKVMKSRESDVVISNADAAKVIGTPSNLNFLRECKVMIVLD